MSSIVVAGDTSGTITLSAPAISGTSVLTLPVATDTLIGKATSDVLTNKTLTAPTMTAPVLGTPTSGTLTNCTGLPVAGGGTGAATHTINSLLVGNGTSAVTGIAPSTTGNVLTSNGSTWVSTAPAAGGISTGLSIALAMVMGF